MSGRFITVEGGEGVGKSTNLAFIEHFLRSRGVAVTVTREPGGTALGEALRQLLLSTEGDTPVAMAELLMMFAARAQHLASVIEPALARGEWVLCDRFTDATYAYQGAGRGMSMSIIGTLENLVQGQRQPDLSVLLDVAPEIGMARASARGDLDRFEQEQQAFFHRVRDGYLERVARQPQRWLVVDAGEPLEAVQAELSTQLNRVIDRWLS